MQVALHTVKRGLTIALVLAATGFALYTGGAGPYSAPLQRAAFLLLMLPLVFLMVPSGLRWGQAMEDISAIILSALSTVTFTWTILNYERLYSDPFIGRDDFWLGAIGLALVLESVRRTVGLAITIIFIGFLFFAYYGPSVPVAELRHSGLDTETIVSMIFYGTDGVFGTATGVAATFIVVIIILGALLTATGGAQLFMNLAKGVAGRFTGGPAKIAVIGSALMGMITGATVANVATTGAVTIPMMKRSGYKKEFAGAVEALASSGGQIMPPIMGAAAFVMIDYLNMDYFELVTYAIVPAILYFFSVLMIVHVRSVKRGFGGIPTSELPSLSEELKARGHMLIPIIVLVGLMSQQLSIMYVAFFSVVSAMLVCMLRSTTRLDLVGFYRAFENAMESMAPLVAICAGAGILIGVLTATGLNLKITYLIDYVAQGNLFMTLVLTMIACIILGMGLPTVAAYVVLATLVPASLIKLGVPPIAAHLFIFYFAILSAVTPPVCTGAYVAAGIAGANPLKTGIEAMKLGIVVFLLPFAFVYNPSLLLIGDFGEIVLHITSAVLGIMYWSYGLEGYFMRPMGFVKRALLIIGGALLIWPMPLVSLAGFIIATPVLVIEYMATRGRRETVAQAAADASPAVSGSDK